MMKKVILILLLLATLAVAWWYFEPKAPSVQKATVKNVDVKQVIANRNSGVEEDKEGQGDGSGQQDDARIIEPANIVATVSDAGELAVALPEGERYPLSAGSVVQWLGKKVGGEHNGDVQISDGVLIVQDGSVVGGSFTMDMNTIKARDIDDAGLDDHLKEWFNVENYPTATFTLLESSSTQVVGIMTINGISKEISFPASITIEDDIVIANASFALDRNNWDVAGGTPAVSEYMELTLDLTARK